MAEIEKILFFGNTWCPACRVAKRIFIQKSIEYKWINIDDDQEARAYVEKVNNGYRSVPAIVFPDGDILTEPSNSILRQKLDSLA